MWTLPIQKLRSELPESLGWNNPLLLRFQNKGHRFASKISQFKEVLAYSPYKNNKIALHEYICVWQQLFD